MNTGSRQFDHGAVVAPLHETGLEVVRALGRCGVEVTGVDSDLHRPAARSRYCKQVIRADIASEAFIDTLVSIGRRTAHKHVLFPASDAQVLLVSHHRDVLEEYYHINLPDRDTVDMLMYKDQFEEYSHRHGFVTPRTFTARTAREVKDAAGQIHYPCILKPSVRTPAWEREGIEKNFIATSLRELVECYQSVRSFMDDVIIQEWIPGCDTEVYFCLVYFNAQSQLVASYTGKKIQQWPPQRGCTAIAVGCSDAWVTGETVRFMRQVGFRGLGSMEYKRHAGNGRYFMIEPTVGRIDLQSGIAGANGVNFPFIAYADMTGLDYRPPESLHSAGVTWVHEEGTLRAALYLLRGREFSPRRWLASLRGRKVYAVFARDDINPLWNYVYDIPRRIYRNKIKGKWNRKAHSYARMNGARVRSGTGGMGAATGHGEAGRKNGSQ